MKHLKLFFALFAMLALGVGNAWGAEVTFTANTDKGTTQNTSADSMTKSGIKISSTSAGLAYAEYRFYNGTITISTDVGNITSIKFTCTTSAYATTLGNSTTSAGSLSTSGSTVTWEGSSSSFTIKNTAQTRASKIVVTYEAAGDGGENPGEGDGEDPVDPTPGTGESGTIVIKYNSTFAPALPTASGSVNTTATAHTAEGLSFKEKGIYKGSSNSYLMFTQDKGFLYNTQSLGTITSVSVTYTSGTSTSGQAGVYFGTTEQSTYTTTNNSTIKGQSKTDTWTNTTKGNGFFQLSTSNKNVQITQIEITYTSGSEGGGTEEPVASLTDEQLNWSATSATALKGADNNEFPTLTNELSVPVTYTSSNTSVATIEADGKITLLAPGTTTISAIFAGSEVSGTKYAAKTVSYTLTVKQLVSCADIYNLADDATFVLKDFVVTYVNGDYTYLKDATGYGVIYKNSYGLQAGDQVASGKLEGKKDTYKGLVEIIPTTTAADLNATSGTAPEPEVMTNTPTNADINKYVKFENVSFKYTNLNDTYKTNSGKLEGQTEYNIAFYNKFTSNVTFDTSKKYDVVGVVSIKDDAIEVYFISAEEVAEPTLNVTITNEDFGKIAIDGKAERTLTLNGSLLTKPVSLAIEGEGAEHFKLSSSSVDPTDDGNITNAKIKITYNPTAEGTHTPTLKITSDDVAVQTISLKGQAVQEYTVHFYVHGEEDETLKKTVLSGNTLEELPTATSCDLLNYPTFAGWASAAIDGTTDVKPTMLDQSTPITSDCNYYAVFAKETTTSGSTTSAIMEYTGGTTTNMNDGNNATIVGLDETLFNITSTKTASGTHVGLNKDNDIRLYANKNDGNGNILTISMLDGSSITKITLDIKQEANFVVKANGKSITGADNVYNIDYPSCSIQNTTTGATTQLHLNSVTIEYTTSITTYEYITSCAAVVPTCEITYDYADGEGECTNDIVEEGTEYTLCATAPTKTGHTFLNWKDQNGVEYAEGATINSVTEDLTLTAQWQVNLYKVTWMSLGSKLSSSDVNYNTQPTQPTTNPTYLCGTDKEFVGWTTQEIDGIGVPTNLYTDEFPVVTEAITYHAVFASKIEGGGSMSKAVSLTNGETVYLVTESGIGVTGANTSTNKDATVSTTQGDWMPFTVVTNGLQYQFKTGDNYITAAAKSFKITNTPSDFAFENGYIVYNVPSGSDPGDYVLLLNNNNGGPFYRFYKKSNIGKENYETFYVYKNPTHTDYVTSCEEVGSDMSNSTKVTPSVENGIFSVDDGKYVQFSTGNLQYEVGTNTWSFASEQYEVVGGATYDPANPTNTNYGMNEPGYTGKLDLFGWSSDGKFGVNPSNTDAHYGYAGSDFVDWGKLVDGEDNWYTLTKDEMKYILARTKNGKKLWALATVCGMNGLILLPDNWNTSTTLEYGYIPTDWNYEKNQLDDAAWAALEAAGAVFLPEGGSRVGGHGNKDNATGPSLDTPGATDAHGDYFHVDNVGEMGYYWLNTQDTRTGYENYASFLILPGWNDNGTPNIENDDKALAPQVWSREKRRGNSVRLVKEVKPYTRDDQGAGVYGTVCYPENIVWADGATLYEVAGKEGNKVIFDEVTTPEAGMPYIFIAEKEKVNFFCGSATATEAGEHNSLQGTFTQIDPAVDNILVGNYMLVNNIIKKCGINCGLYANRAYFVADDLEKMDKAPAAAPGRRRISLDVTSENTTTGLDNITNGEDTTIKVIENGQLIIIRNGEKYNAMGVKF